MHFQDLILSLQTYWSNHGCLITQPYDVEKGAGTFNPATFLRALGPEPFSAAYVEPCRRPTDGRYGENPIRLQHYFQYQVVMKPNPDDFLDLYIGSLREIGIRPQEHDIRFVHDDWESPTLGAWGLGWEVWADGMEITQFTYFQQVGGIELRPVMGEITYGLERICMFIQDVDNVYDLAYDSRFTYGDLFHQNEVMGSRYNFELADVAFHGGFFKDCEKACRKLSEAGNPTAALDYCLKASHAFNILDARGALSVNERQEYILRVRRLAQMVAESWVAAREALGFPLGAKCTADHCDSTIGQTTMPMSSSTGSDRLGDTAPFLVEVGVEEMPARVFTRLASDVVAIIHKFLDDADLDIQDLRVFHTPRRIAVSIASIRTRQPDRIDEVKGPPMKIARDKSGNWTKAAIGFARKNGVEPEELDVTAVKGVEYLMARIDVPGRPTVDVLRERLPAILSAIPWYKTMRWGGGSTQFVRPVVWLVARLGDAVIPFEFGNCVGNRLSQGHRFLSSRSIEAPADRESFIAALEREFVIVDQDQRRNRISQLLNDYAGREDLQWIPDDELLDEVTDLVEYPFPILCRFDDKYLRIPAICLISEMKKHQKYFPLHTSEGALAATFIVISNMKVDKPDVVRKGCEKVLRSRFEDADFFIREDLKTSLADRVPNLASAVFQQRLGSMLDKVDRIKALTEYLGDVLALDHRDLGVAREIAHLCKSDLYTQMVGEFPELQGEIGRYYAQRQGLSEAVADGILDHYRPRSLTDRFPASDAAAIVGLADRMDSLVGIFAIGKAPTGSADPFALRRACLTSIAIIINRGLHLDIHDVIGKAIDGISRLGLAVNEADLRAQVLDFVLNRLTGLFQEQIRPDLPGGYAPDLIRSVVHSATPWYDIADLAERLRAMDQFRTEADFIDVAATFKRAHNIVRDDSQFGAVNDELFLEDAERSLWQAVLHVDGKVSDKLNDRQYFTALCDIAPLRDEVNRFFDAVLVNDPDETLRSNRRNLVFRVVQLVRQLADFSQLQSG